MERKFYLVVATFLGLAFSSCTNEVTEEIIAEASGKSSNEESEVVELKSGFTITKKDGSTFVGQRNGLSDGDRRFPNYFYLPYIARSDTYAELDTVMYDGNNVRLTRAQIRDIQAQLNNGNPNPPANGRIENNF